MIYLKSQSGFLMLFEKFIHGLIVLSSSITLISKLLRITHIVDELQYSENSP